MLHDRESRHAHAEGIAKLKMDAGVKNMLMAMFLMVERSLDVQRKRIGELEKRIELLESGK